MAEVLEGLEVHEQAMRANLDRSRGLVYSENVALHLSRALGKQAAHALTEELCERAARDGKDLIDVVRADPQAAAAIEARELSDLFNPERCFGASAAMIERALAQWAQSIKS
jgi:3-carboxy-cis,cis-muconate cycloisomerase